MPNENRNYYTELTHNRKHAGFTVSPEENKLLHIELDGKPLCWATESGGVRWQHSDIDDDRRPALDSVIDIAKTTHEYMRQMEAAPKLTADGLEGDYRLLSEFNGTVLAGHPTQYGVQFVTWDRTYNQTGLWQGHFIGPQLRNSRLYSCKAGLCRSLRSHSRQRHFYSRAAHGGLSQHR